MRIRFRYPTDQSYDAGHVLDLDSSIAELYINRGCAELIVVAAKRFAVEASEPKVYPKAKQELMHLQAFLTKEELAQIGKLVDALNPSTEVAVEPIPNKMVKPSQVKRKDSTHGKNRGQEGLSVQTA